MEIVDRLKPLGHTAIHAAELSPGRPDATLLRAASQAGQVLITNDRDSEELLGAFVLTGPRSIRLRVPD